MTRPLTLTLFIKSDDPASDRARQDLQAALAVMTEGPAVSVNVIGEPEAAALGISVAPVLRVQRGSGTPQWIVQLDRESLLDRFALLGLLPTP